MTPQPSELEAVDVQIGESVFSVARSRLGAYIDLNTLLEALIEAVPTGDNSAIADCLFEYLRLATSDLDRGLFESAPWYEVMIAFNNVRAVNAIPHADRYAILNAGSGDKWKPVPWDYPGRTFMIWKHLIAKAYGWSLEQIDHLWPEQAIIFIMEIIADEQADMEFVHQLSELAYEYDKATKKSRYKPLRRPLWMVEGSQQTKEERKKSLLTQLRKDALPQGNVIGVASNSEK